jgi:3-hydroxymyristoyl/3-hydroxydecanoyl-(acyl carrier protein) dehydratase
VDGTLTLNGSSITGGTVANNSDGEIDLTGTASLSTGTLDNAGKLKVSGTGNALHGETVTANKELDIAASAALTIDLGSSVANTQTTVDGTLTLNGSSITGGTITSNSDGEIDLTGSGVLSTGTLDNAGKLKVTGTGNALHGETVTANNELDIAALAALTINLGSSVANTQTTVDGTLTLNGSSITGGTVTNNSDGEIDLTGWGVFASGTLDNAGKIKVNGTGNALHDETVTANKELDIAASAALTIDQNSSVTNTQTTVDGTLTLNGSSITGGTVTNNSDGEIDLTGTTSLSTGTLDNAGKLGVSGTGNALHGETVTANNELDVAASAALTIDLGSSVANTQTTVDGTLTLNGSSITGGTVANNSDGEIDLTGTASLSTGTLDNAGKVKVSGTGNALHDETVTANHELDIAASAALTIDQNSSVANTQTTVDGTLTLNGSSITGGTVTNNSDGEIDLTGLGVLSSGTLDNAGKLKVTGTGNALHGETVAANNELDIAASAALAIDLGSSVANTQMTVDGSLTLDGSSITGGSIKDNSDGSIKFSNTVQLTGGVTIQGQSNAQLGVITNLGLLEILGAATLLDVTVTNTDHNIQVDASKILDFDNSTITSGTLTVYGELDSTGTSFINNATIINQNNIHVVSGTLTIDPSMVTNGGTILVDSQATLDLQSSEIDGGKITIDGELDSTGNSTISGATIVNDGVIDIKSGTLTIDATSVLSGTGGIKTDGGSLVLDGALVGNIEISGTATVELGSSSSSAYSSTIVTFDAGSQGTLKLDHAKDFGGNVAGFSTGQTLDLADISYASKPIVVYAGGVLEVYVNGHDVANINLTGDYRGVQWVLSSDGHGGTDITESTEGVLTASLDHSTAQQGVTMHATGVTDGGNAVFSGVSYAWQMSADGQTWSTVGTLSSFTPGEAQEGHVMQLVVSYTDAAGTQDVVYGLGMPNDLAVTVDQTTAQQGLPIDVTSVTDGGTPVSHGVTYLWETSTDGHNWTQVGHSSSYTPSFTSDGGKLLQLVVSYSDPGESESVTDSFGTVAPAKEWTGGSHSWETGSAWSPAGPPTSTDNAVVDTNGHVTVDQASTAALSLVENASQATVEIAFGGKLTLGGNLVIDQGHFQVDFGGALKDIANSAIISGSFTNNGTVEAGGGKLEITDAVSGFGNFKIDAGATLQLDHASSESVTFSSQGTLALEDPTHFRGIISDSTGSLTDKDVLDLAGFDTKASIIYVGGTSLGAVVVSENGKVATIAVGANTTHWTKPVSDGHGGILIEDPVENDAAPNANTSHGWSTAGADSFVFKTNPGANAALDAEHSPVWPEPDHPGSVAKLAQFLQNHDVAGLPTIPGLQDSVTPDSLKTQLLSHHNEFHFI